MTMVELAQPQTEGYFVKSMKHRLRVALFQDLLNLKIKHLVIRLESEEQSLLLIHWSLRRIISIL